MKNQPLKIVIVGGVAGGATAAARARRVNANAEIILLEKGPTVSFANCGLPYHLGGEISDRGQLLVATRELFQNRFRVQVHTGYTVDTIDRAAQTVSGHTLEGATFSIAYDKLILSTGSEPLRPDFCNVEANNVFNLWTLDDMDRILSCVKTPECRSATVIGAGFVGLEVVEQLARRNVSVTLVERLPQVLGPLDAEMAKMVELELVRHNIRVFLNASVSKLHTTDGKVSTVQLANGESIATDLVIVGAGVRPRIELAQAAGLTIGQSGGVAINEFCQTSDANIYAVGDMVEYFHGVLDKPIRVPLAGPANRAGRIAGSHAARPSSSGRMSPVQGTSIVRVFDLTAGITGLNERACNLNAIACRTAIIQAPHHASYFPGAKNLTLKLIYSPESRRVLGAQAVGAEGVDKRLDVVATLLHFKGTIDDLAGLDLAYAPPFGSAKDPVHNAAFVAQNDLDHYPRLVASNANLEGQQIVDVRNKAEIEKLPLPDAIHIPVDEIASRWEELDPAKPTVVVCHSAKRAHVAASWLQGKGFQTVYNLSGGMSIRKLTE